MAARNAKHSISTILRKIIGDCEQYTSFRSALSELTNVEVTYKIKEIKRCAFYVNYKKSAFFAIIQANDGYILVFFLHEKLAQYLFMLIFLLVLMHICINKFIIYLIIFSFLSE